MRRCLLVLGCLVLSLALAASAAAAPPAPPAEPAPQVTLPIWTSDYKWPTGDGYSGWQSQVFGAGERDAFGLTTGLGSFPGLWIWPVGAREYRPGGAEWVLRAPGTTRIARASLDLGYRNKLFAHHCLDIGLRTAIEQRSARRDCKPPQPPIGEDAYALDLHDPSGQPTAKEVYVRLDLPVCNTGNVEPCSKQIPALDPQKNGAMTRVKKIDLVLVDDDLPAVTPSRAFYELDGQYIDGKETYALRVDSADAGAGISRIDLDHSGWPGPQPSLAEHASPCDPRHHASALEARVCPENDAIDLEVHTKPMPEGTRHFRAHSLDPAGNVGEHKWTVIIDRTAPTPPKDFRFTMPEEGSGQPVWEAATDPVLPDATPGSGVTKYRFRSRVEDGEWSEWTTVGADSLIGEELYDHPAGTKLSFQAVAIDLVGNVSEVTETSGEVWGAAPVVTASGALADAADGFLPAGEFPVTVWANDGDGAGVRRVRLEHVGGAELGAGPDECLPRERNSKPWKAHCPTDAGRDFTVDTRQLPEGRQTFRAEAADRPTNVGMRSWSVTIDRTAPTVPGNQLSAVFSSEVGETDVFWSAASDPELADGTSGSGVGGYVYRFRREGGEWSPWDQTDDESFYFEQARANEHIDVELRTRDRAGNTSDTITASVTAIEAASATELSFFGGDEDTTMAVDAASRAAISDELDRVVTDEPTGDPASPASIAEAVVQAEPVPNPTLMSIADARESSLGRDALADAGIEATAASKGGLDKLVLCVIGGRGEGAPKRLPEYHGEKDIAVRATLSSYCSPNPFPFDGAKQALAADAYANMTLQVTTCLQVDYENSFIGDETTIKCQPTKKRTPAKKVNELESSVTQLCKPGAPYYRLKVTVRSSSPGYGSDKSTVYTGFKNGTVPTEHRLECNEPGAWRRLASRDGDAGRYLGNSLVSKLTWEGDRDDLPAGIPNGGRRGWEAHHIINADFGRGTTSRDAEASRQQRYGYSCDIDPNSAINGVWLRGPQLYSDKDAYDRYLSPFGRRRPAHQPIHTTKHFKWVSNYANNHATLAGRCLSYGGMNSALRRMREIIVADDAPQ